MCRNVRLLKIGAEKLLNRTAEQGGEAKGLVETGRPLATLPAAVGGAVDAENACDILVAQALGLAGSDKRNATLVHWMFPRSDVLSPLWVTCHPVSRGHRDLLSHLWITGREAGMVKVTGGHALMPSGDAMRLGRMIREARESLGWSQEDLARRLGVDRTTVGKWETGVNEPDLSMLRKLSEVLGLSARQILGNVSDGEEVSPELRLRRLGMTLRGAGLRDHEVEYVLGIIRERQEERKRRKLEQE